MPKVKCSLSAVAKRGQSDELEAPTHDQDEINTNTHQLVTAVSDFLPAARFSLSLFPFSPSAAKDDWGFAV